MNEQWLNMLKLLKKAIHPQFSEQLIGPVNWDEIFIMAKKHNVLPLVYEMACKLETFKGTAEYNKYMMLVMFMVAEQTKRTQNFLELYGVFSKAELYPIVMKGIVCRELYGKYADYRPSGDEDILIREEEYEDIKKTLLAQGFLPMLEEVNETQLCNLQEISFINKKTGLHIEVHLNPIGLENDLRKKMNAYFNNVFEHKIFEQIRGNLISTMSYSDHFLFLVLHAFKHLLNNGVGIRQVVDILKYMESFTKQIDWEYIDASLRNVGAEKFFVDLIYIGNKYLGFSFSISKSPNCPELLLQDIMHRGAFGNGTQILRTSGHMALSAGTRKKKNNRFMMFVRAVFPNKQKLLTTNPELERFPWLLPVCWLKRWIKFIKKNKLQSGNLVFKSIDLGMERIELLKNYDVL